MRQQGRIAEWKDDRGFGFVTPGDGGPRVFVHVKAFANRQWRPVVGDLVTYELGVDPQGRPRGVRVAFAGEGVVPSRRASRPSRRASRPGPGLPALGFAVVFLGLVGTGVAVGRLPFPVLLVLFVASCLAYLAYFFDKVAALQGRWRTEEATLHLLGLVGGWPGALLAQRTLRHKTRKPSFQVTFWVTVLLNCAALGWLSSPSGARVLRALLRLT